MDSHHRKVDLQSPLDLSYLSSTITAAAQEKIDLHLPPSAQVSSDTDLFRAQVSETVHQYIKSTINSALSSISINGLDANAAQLSATKANDKKQENYEPYDPHLASELRELYAQLEVETTKVAELRRDAPTKAADAYLRMLKAEMDRHETNVDEQRRGVAEDAMPRKTGLETVEFKRHQNIQQAWNGACADLETLRGVTEAVAVLERAKAAASELGAL